MKTDEFDPARLNAITERVIGCAFRVHNQLGAGFLERVFENALAHELTKAGIAFERQVRLNVWYDGVIVGEFVADLIVERCILIEIKAIKNLDDSHMAQSINYLACTRLPLCLLLNFSMKVEVKRIAGRSFRIAVQPRESGTNFRDEC